MSIAYGDGDEFTAALGETTALSLLSPQAAQEKEPTVYTPSLVRQIHEFEWGQVQALPERSGPTFAFAHFLLPHPPYVYAADGSAPGPGIPEDERYVQQVEYTNQRLLETIDVLLDVPAAAGSLGSSSWPQTRVRSLPSSTPTRTTSAGWRLPPSRWSASTAS